MVHKIAIFGSGNGSNAEQIIGYCSEKNNLEVALIVSDNPTAFILERAKRNNMASLVISKKFEADGKPLLEILQFYGIRFIVLAGFLRKVPRSIINKYPNRIINIHPSLLPLFGGEGMYGKHVHDAVLSTKQKKSGITIHFVNEEYDLGKIILQATCNVSTEDTLDTLANKIHVLEYRHFAPTIAFITENMNP